MLSELQEGEVRVDSHDALRRRVVALLPPSAFPILRMHKTYIRWKQISRLGEYIYLFDSKSLLPDLVVHVRCRLHR